MELNMSRRALRLSKMTINMGLRASLAAAAVWCASSCHEGIDTARRAPPKATLGDDMFGVLCDRVGADSLTEDLTGASYRAICHYTDAGAYGDKVDTSALTAVTGDVSLKARALGVAKPPRSGWAILGANGLGLALAERLARAEEVVMIDVAPERCRQARASGLRVVEANALEETTFGLEEIEGRLRFVGATPNEEVNFIFARRARELLKAQEVWVGLRRDHSAIHPEMVEEIRGQILFGHEHRLGLWASRIETGLVEIETRVAGENAAPPPADSGPEADFLPLVRRRQDVSTPYSDGLPPKPGDEVDFAIVRSRLDEARAALDSAGWLSPSEPTT